MLEKLEKAGTALEDGLLVALLLAMILLAAGQIIGRNLFSTTFILGDEALRLMVLWLTLAGGIAASRADRHISIALLDRYLDRRWLAVARVVTHGFTAGVCGLIGWFSFRFVQSSYEFGDTLLGDQPAWLLQLILPVGFFVMSYRHSVHALGHGLRALRGRGAG